MATHDVGPNPECVTTGTSFKFLDRQLSVGDQRKWAGGKPNKESANNDRVHNIAAPTSCFSVCFSLFCFFVVLMFFLLLTGFVLLLLLMFLFCFHAPIEEQCEPLIKKHQQVTQVTVTDTRDHLKSVR
jgi:hypothetical protein